MEHAHHRGPRRALFVHCSYIGVRFVQHQEPTCNVCCSHRPILRDITLWFYEKVYLCQYVGAAIPLVVYSEWPPPWRSKGISAPLPGATCPVASLDTKICHKEWKFSSFAFAYLTIAVVMEVSNSMIRAVHGSTKSLLAEPNWVQNDFVCTCNAYFLTVGKQSTVAPLRLLMMIL